MSYHYSLSSTSPTDRPDWVVSGTKEANNQGLMSSRTKLTTQMTARGWPVARVKSSKIPFGAVDAVCISVAVNLPICKSTYISLNRAAIVILHIFLLFF